jgi:peptidoglycan/xylan/chitin deacetylase (PgdA/CDA1 family)
MICLTGDIHHSSLRINDHRFIPDPGDSEPRIAARYLRLIEKHNLKVTFYVTGKTLAEEWDALRPLADSPHVEIGGHTYGGLPRPLRARLRTSLTGRATLSHSLSHGSRARQKRDVQRMIGIVQEKTGRRITSWRSHGLVSDEHTYGILAECGIRFISDDLDWGKTGPERMAHGLVSHPINVIMDHDHIYHAHRTREYVEVQKRNWTFTTDPTRESYDIEAWAAIVERQVREIQEAGGVATVLMHPLCMHLADGFRTAERLLGFFSRFPTVWANEMERFLEEKQAWNGSSM